MGEVISLDLYFTDYITKKDRRQVYADQFRPEIQSNAVILLQKVNALLNDLGVTNGDVTSGWRPPSVNSIVTNAAKQSYHMNGMAVDILDDKAQTLVKLVSSRPDLLRKYGLFVEDMNYTRGINTNWCHLDYGTRADRPSRSFIP